MKWGQAVHSHYCPLKMQRGTGSKWYNACLYEFNWIHNSWLKIPLRIGLSATVKVNVSDSQGETLRNQAPSTTLYSTNVLQYDESAVNNLIESIIRDNSY